jgi:hypothetical protein
MNGDCNEVKNRHAYSGDPFRSNFLNRGGSAGASNYYVFLFK